MSADTIDPTNLGTGDLAGLIRELDEATNKIVLMTDPKASEREVTTLEALRLIASVRLSLEVAIPAESEADHG